MRQTTEAEYGDFARSAWPRLYRTAVLIVGDRQLGEDLVQSALVKTYVAWPRLRERDKALAYTRRATTARRVAITPPTSSSASRSTSCSALLNVTTGTVKSQTSAALAALRSHAHLAPEGPRHD